MEQPIDFRSSDLTWSRLLDILQPNSDHARRFDAVAQLDGSHTEAAPDFQSTSPSRSSQSGQSSPRGHDHDPEAGFPAPLASRVRHHQHPRTHQPQQVPQSSESHGSQSRSLLLISQLGRRAQAATAADHAVTADPDGASVSASAERHRLITESAGISVQVRRVVVGVPHGLATS
jgi:hypothetical protein